MTHARIASFLIWAALLSPVLVSSQDRSAGRSRGSTRDSTYVITAGSSHLSERDGEQVLVLTEGVKIVHGDVTITSRTGTQYAKRGVSYLDGDVTITQQTLVMRGEECEYRRNQDLAILKRNVRIDDQGWNITCNTARLNRTRETVWLIGNVVAADSATTLEADSLFYDRARMTAEAYGAVRITNLDEGFTVTGRHGFYYRDSRLGVVDRDPVLIVDPKSTEPATVVSDTMRFYPDRREASSFGRVKIIKGETVTQCDSAAVFDEEQIAELYGNPLARQGRSSMQGRKMVLHYSGSEVDKIRIEGNAEIKERQADSLVTGRDSWIQGELMYLYLSESVLDSIGVRGNCVSEYYPGAARKVESNFVRGDSMFFQFEADSLTHVDIVGDADGIYKYLNLGDAETSDSLRAAADSALTYVPFREKAEKVSYSASHIEYFADSKDILLKGKGKVYYRNRTLLGEEITYNSTLQLLDAQGEPVLIEANDKFYGLQMDYDLDSGVGLVKNGSTQFQEGFYFGRHVAKVGDNILKVWNSTYTTCDLEKPHYHFASKEMKVFLRDKVISGPIWLYIGDTPIAFLPFMANNISKGRRSGVLRPEFEFGITKSTGRFIRNFGYYWATNDYTDFTFVGDFNEDASFRVLVDNRYKLRYRFDGSARFSFYRNLSNFTNEWMLNSTHRQTLGDKFTFNSDLRFVSSDRAPSSISRIDQVADVIDRRIESKMSVRKSWNSVGFSASARRVQQLNVTEPGVVKVSTTFPDVTLSIPSRTLYFGTPSKGRNKSFWEKVLGNIRFSPGVSGKRTTELREYTYTLPGHLWTQRRVWTGDTTYYLEIDSTTVYKDRKTTINQNLSVNFSSPTRLGFITVSPRLTASNAYTRNTRQFSDSTTLANGETVDSDNIFRWSTGASARTNFYGTFYPEIGSLSGLRHTITPSVSYSYNPKVGSRPSSQGFSVSLTNSIDLKVRDGDKDRKISNVLIWDLSSSYNPKAPKRQGWSTVSSRVNVKIFGTNVSFNQTIQPYDGDILSTSVTSYINLRGSHGFGSSREAAAPVLNVVARDTANGEPAEEQAAEGERPGGPGGGSTWNVGMAFSYSKSSYGTTRATLNMNSSFNLTRNWKFTYSTTFDMENREFLGQNYSINRNLHCWEMSFSRQKLGDEWQYYFRINIKAHPEIYAESGRRGLGGGGYGVPSIY